MSKYGYEKAQPWTTDEGTRRHASSAAETEAASQSARKTSSAMTRKGLQGSMGVMDFSTDEQRAARHGIGVPHRIASSNTARATRPPAAPSSSTNHQDANAAFEEEIRRELA